MSKLSLYNLVLEQASTISDRQMIEIVKEITGYLDGWVSAEDMRQIRKHLLKLQGQRYKGVHAYKKFKEFYSGEERGVFFGDEDFEDELARVTYRMSGTELGIEKEKTVNLIIQLNKEAGDNPNKSIADYLESIGKTISSFFTGNKNKSVSDGGGNVKPTTSSAPKPRIPGSSTTSAPKPSINKGNNTTTKQKTTTKTTIKNCSSFPMGFGCKSDKIKLLQKTLGITTDGIIGAVTIKAVTDLGYDLPNKQITQDIYNKIVDIQTNIDVYSLTQKQFVNHLLEKGKLKVDKDVDNIPVFKYDETDLSKDEIAKLVDGMEEVGYKKLTTLEKDFGTDLVFKRIA